MDDYEREIIAGLDDLCSCASRHRELKRVINDYWKIRIQHIVSSWGRERAFQDGGYNFYRILTDGSISPEELEQKLCIVADLAKRQQKNREYRKTRGELRSKQDNQVLAALFEINILSSLIERVSNVDLFPSVGSGGQNVEARINVDNRWVYVEAKALGYSRSDPCGRVGTMSVESMMRQVRTALLCKLEEDKQLGQVAKANPAILCLALGFKADKHTGSWEIEDFLSESISNVSRVFLFESSFCKVGMKAFVNQRSTLQLTTKEMQTFTHAFSRQ